MCNDIRVSELLGRMQSDLEEWEDKASSAHALLVDANAKASELRQAIDSLTRYVPGIAAKSERLEEMNSGEFTGMSTRQAIKIVLQRAEGALPSSAIAAQLTAGGIKSTSASFRSNVSATLSVMQSQYHEVQKTPQGWILSQPVLANADSHASEAAA